MAVRYWGNAAIATLRVSLLHAALAGAAALALGCKPTYYRKDADREVYRIIASKQAKALGGKAPFSIDPPEETAVERLFRAKAPSGARPSAAKAAAGLDLPQFENGLPKRPGVERLGLREALELAARYSRDYQTQKETLYGTALALTLERFKWTPQWSGKLSAQRTKGPDDSPTQFASDFSVSQLLGLGGKVSAGLATTVIRHTTGDPLRTAASLLSLDAVQPLWRGAGRRVAQETLTQAERDTIYAVRTFARFQKTFCVDITGSYYRVLQQRDAVANQWDNYQRIQQSRERTEAMAKAGRRPEFEVDQARQEEFNAKDSWISALRAYEDGLDQFKLALSLPAEAPVELEPKEVDRLREAGLRRVELPADRAVGVAVERRLDLLTAVDKVADAERKVQIARNGLGPDINLRFSGKVPSEAPTQAAHLQAERGTYIAGIDAELPLRRKAERNAYRESLIALEQAARGADKVRDDIKLSVFQDWRALQEAAQSYEIQQASVDLARRRVESTTLLLQRGTASARDVLDANASLVAAQNALTRALIDHTLARLALWRDTELLRVGEDGVWQEVTDVNP